MTGVMEPHVGPLLRNWRARRKLTQLELANRTGISARHISFVETGKARPGRAMLLRVTDELGVPARQRNEMFVAAGYAPFCEPAPVEIPRTRMVEAAIARLLKGHEPYPAIATDSMANVVAMNRATEIMLQGLPAALLTAPVNAMRLALHPEGMARHVVNLAEWRGFVLERLRGLIAQSGRECLLALYDEVTDYPCPDAWRGQASWRGHAAQNDTLAYIHLRAFGTELRLFETVTTFSTTSGAAVSGLSLEFFHPADEHTASAFDRNHAASEDQGGLLSL